MAANVSATYSPRIGVSAERVANPAKMSVCPRSGGNRSRSLLYSSSERPDWISYGITCSTVRPQNASIFAGYCARLSIRPVLYASYSGRLVRAEQVRGRNLRYQGSGMIGRGGRRRSYGAPRWWCRPGRCGRSGGPGSLLGRGFGEPGRVCSIFTVYGI
ncbi:hypothetical protein M501DRAFT_170042 [Patellaria atrata CBS 101060]|uniref:Uncharacterized protein n=1 Tax=Patellaria atrata CBS 101060 TaxID=1346257 RepID=A0A9P4S7M1_9PEZI|nr:hypothetical protein M501DRAFT_170042 [Patellaria atrata CBS 101060]